MGIIFRNIFIFAFFCSPPAAHYSAYLLLWLQSLSYQKDTVTGQVSRLTEHRQQSRGSQGPFWGRWGSCYWGQWLSIIRGFSFQKTMPPVYDTQPVLLPLSTSLSTSLICSFIHWQRRRNVNERLWEPEGKIWDFIEVQRKWYLAKMNVDYCEKASEQRSRDICEDKNTSSISLDKKT